MIGTICVFPAQGIEPWVYVDGHAASVFGVRYVAIAKTIRVVIVHRKAVAPPVMDNRNGFFDDEVVFEHKIEELAEVVFDFFVRENLPLM